MCRISRCSLWQTVLVCVAAILLFESAAQAQSRRQSVLPSSRELSRLGLEMAWWSQSTIDPGSDRVLYLTADEDAVYAQSRTGIITAFDAENGEQLWAQLVGRPNAATFPIVTNDNQVLVATGMNLHALNKRTGRRDWHLQLPHHPSTAPGIDDTQAYIGTLDGSAYAYNLRTVRELYQEQRLPEWSNVALVWRYQTGTELSSPPVSSGRNVSFASLDGSLYSISRSRGSLTFQFETNGAIRTPVGRSKNSLFIASDDVRFFCIDIDNGRLKWTFVPGLPIRQQPRIVGDGVYVAPERGGLYKLAVETGRINWHQTRATGFLAATDDRVYASDELGNVLVLSHSDGAMISSLPLRMLNVRVSNDRTDRMFLATSTGTVVALKELDSEFPRYHKFPERQPILPPMGPAPEEGSAAEEGAAQPPPQADEATPAAPEGAAPAAPGGVFDF
jgi:outer membrane protein assembly factor BamB